MLRKSRSTITLTFQLTSLSLEECNLLLCYTKYLFSESYSFCFAIIEYSSTAMNQTISSNVFAYPRLKTENSPQHNKFTTFFLVSLGLARLNHFSVFSRRCSMCALLHIQLLCQHSL